MVQISSPNPKMDFGFFAAIPRIVRTHYNQLNPTEKWLYVCLKDLCGDYGICFRTLRVLATETGISIAMLSKSIPALHDAGLIHAEKKRRRNNPTGKEVWHITMADIWALNGKAYPTRHGQEQQCSYGEQSIEGETDNVHDVNNNVPDINNNGLLCSYGEQQCSLYESPRSYDGALEAQPEAENEDRRKNKEGRTEGRKNREGSEHAGERSPSSPRLLVSHPIHDFLFLDDPVKPSVLTCMLTSKQYESEQEDDRRGFIAGEVKYELELAGHHVDYQWLRERDSQVVDAAPGGKSTAGAGKKRASAGKKAASAGDDTPSRSVGKKKAAAADLLAQASPLAQAVIAEWLSVFKTPKPVTAAMIAQAEILAGYEPAPGEIIACRDWMYSTDSKGWYRTHGMDLGHVARDFERFRSLKEAPPAGPAPTPAPPGGRRAPAPAPEIDPEAARLNNQATLAKLERMKAAKAAQVAQPVGAR